MMASRKPVAIAPMRSPPSASAPRMAPTATGGDDGDESGQDHLAHSASRADVDCARVVGLGLALHEPGDLTELTAHLLHHCARGSSDRLHRQSGEEEGHEAAEQNAHEYLHVGEVEHTHVGDFRVGRHERECGQHRRPNSEAPCRWQRSYFRESRARPCAHVPLGRGPPARRCRPRCRPRGRRHRLQG